MYNGHDREKEKATQNVSYECSHLVVNSENQNADKLRRECWIVKIAVFCRFVIAIPYVLRRDHRNSDYACLPNATLFG